MGGRLDSDRRWDGHCLRNARGTIFLWPRPDTVSDTLKISCVLPLQDFDASGNNADLPTEWLDTIVWNLAKRLIPSYGASGRASAQEIKQGVCLFQ